MTILNFVGFETGDGLGGANGLQGTSEIQTTVKRSGAYAFRSNPTTTGVGYMDLRTYAANGLTSNFAAANHFFTFWFRYATKPTSGGTSELICDMGGVVHVRLTSDGKLTLWDSVAVSLHATGTAILAADTWYRIDVNVNDTANTQTIKVNGATDISGTVATAAVVAYILIGKSANHGNQTVDFFYDDCCIDDAAHPTNDFSILLSKAIGAGASAGWTNGTGSTFAEVDEVPPDDDTTYIQASATQDNLDSTFDMQSSSTIGITTTIRSVKSTVKAKTASISGSSSVALRTISGGVGREITALELSIGYAELSVVDNTDPNGGGAWNTTKYDALEVGMAANSIAQTQRFTVAYLQAMVDTPTSSQAPRTMHQHMMRRAA